MYEVTFPVRFYLYDADNNFVEMQCPPCTYTLVEKPHPLDGFEATSGKWICFEGTMIGICHRALHKMAISGPKQFRIKIEKIPEPNT